MSKLKVFNFTAIAAIMLAACAAPATPTAAPATLAPAATQAPTALAPAATQTTTATQTPSATQTPAATEAPTETLAGLARVPRNRTLILAWSDTNPIGLTNPWAVPGYTHQYGNAWLWDMLAYYSIYASKEIPWLADSMDYNADFTQLTIKLNPQAAWSDGQPLTSKDVAFSFKGQMTNPKLSNHADFQQFVRNWTTPDAQTLILNFKIPASRFKYEVLTGKFDTGMEIVPEHVLGNTSVVTDVTAYAGGLDMPHSGPYNLVAWDQNQKVYDLRPDWWAAAAGKSAMPAVQRIVMVNIGGQAGQSMDSVVQRLDDNEFDASLDISTTVIGMVLKGNSKVTTWTGDQSPYGSLDWWPNALWMNDQLAPYSDPNVRKAISLVIDRDKLDRVLYGGAKIDTIYPFPLYPNLQKFAGSAPVQALEAQYNPRQFDLEKSAALMSAAGFMYNTDSLWADAKGNTVNATINAVEGIDSDLAPLLVEMLRTGGFDANVNFGPDALQNMVDGKPGLYLWGRGASTLDPYAALNLFNSAFSAPIADSGDSNRFSRYKNPKYDALLATMTPLSADDPRFQDAAAKALGIYWRDTIDIPIVQWLHRIPYNQTYWTNWPLANNLADGENGAFWYFTGMIMVTNLKPVQ